jgi:tight adherence protein B
VVLPDVEEAATQGFSGVMQRIGKRFNAATLLEQANLQYPPGQFIAVVINSALVILLLSLVMGGGLIVGVLLGVTTGSIPVLYVMIKRRRRLNKLSDQLPEVFELMGQALRAGHSLTSAIELVSKELPDPVGTEFGRVFQEQNLGLQLETSLQRMAERIGNMDLNMFVTAVLIQRQTGGDLAELMDNIGEVIRDRIRIMGQVQALTAEGRLSGWALVALPFIVFIAAAILNPEYIQILIMTEKGRWMLGVACVFQILGIISIRKIVNIKI